MIASQMEVVGLESDFPRPVPPDENPPNVGGSLSLLNIDSMLNTG